MDDAPGAERAAVDAVGEGSDAHVERLREYYEDSWFDYRFLWLDPRTRAMHFGYHDGTSATRRHADALLALNAAMADRVALQPGEQVLDAGCGVGGTAFWLTERHDADVLGINMVADHVDRARRYTLERGLGDRPRFRVADFCATGLPDASFDVVWATESACHAPDKQAFVDEVWRVLRPGGRLVMAEYVVFDDQAPSDAVSRWESAWEMHLATRSEWLAAFDRAGLSGAVVDDVTAQVEPSLRRLRRLCRTLGPLAGALHLVGVRTAAQQRNIAGSNAMWEARRAGSWFYAIMTVTKPGP